MSDALRIFTFTALAMSGGGVLRLTVEARRAGWLPRCAWILVTGVGVLAAGVARVLYTGFGLNAKVHTWMFATGALLCVIGTGALLIEGHRRLVDGQRQLPFDQPEQA